MLNQTDVSNIEAVKVDKLAITVNRTDSYRNRLINYPAFGKYLASGKYLVDNYLVGKYLVFALLLGVYSTSYAVNQNNSSAKNSVLSIDLVPALCQLDNNYRRYRQCADGKSVATRSLMIINNRSCHSQSIPKLSPVQAKMVDKFIPDRNIQKQSWQKYGACSRLSASQYFRQVIQKSSHLRLPKEITDGQTHSITTTQLISKFITSNQGLKANDIRLRCQRGHHNKGNQGKLFLTEIQVCYQQNHFHHCATNITDEIPKNTSCGGNITILGK